MCINMSKQKKSVLLGSAIGFLGVKALSKIKPYPKVYIGKKRVHHYWALLGTALPLGPVTKGLFLGAGLEDIKDLRDDIKKRITYRKRK